MRKALLALCAVLVFVSFTNIDKEKTILKDIDGTLLLSYVIVDNVDNTVTFTVDANTTVTSSVINGEFKIFLIENGNSGNSASHTLNFNEVKSLSFDHYFERTYDVASNEEMLYTSFITRKDRPRVVQ